MRDTVLGGSTSMSFAGEEIFAPTILAHFTSAMQVSDYIPLRRVIISTGGDRPCHRAIPARADGWASAAAPHRLAPGHDG
jgi:hypothetical protein